MKSDLREAIIHLHRNGSKNTEIAKSLKCSRSLVYGTRLNALKKQLIFVEKNCKINSDVYMEKILQPMKINLEKHFKNRLFTFQQDGASSHTLKKTQNWLRLNLKKFWGKNMSP